MPGLTGHQESHIPFIHSTQLLFLPCVGYRAGPYSHFAIGCILTKPKIKIKTSCRLLCESPTVTNNYRWMRWQRVTCIRYREQKC